VNAGRARREIDELIARGMAIRTLNHAFPHG
jgi:hypothetical protein